MFQTTNQISNNGFWHIPVFIYISKCQQYLHITCSGQCPLATTSDTPSRVPQHKKQDYGNPCETIQCPCPIHCLTHFHPIILRSSRDIIYCKCVWKWSMHPIYIHQFTIWMLNKMFYIVLWCCSIFFRLFGWQDIPTLMELLYTCFSAMDCDAIHHKIHIEFFTSSRVGQTLAGTVWPLCS